MNAPSGMPPELAEEPAADPAVDASVEAAFDPAAAPAGERASDQLPMPAVVGALLVLLAGLALTLSAMLWNRNRVVAEANRVLDAQTERLERDIVQRFVQPVYGLKGARGAISALNGRVARQAFRAYVQSRDLPREFPGVRGFGFVPRVPREQLDAFIAAERADGALQFSVRSRGDAPDLFVVAHIEPLSQNYPAWGFDLGSERLRRDAIERAIATGEATLSAPVGLVQDRAHGPGMLLLVPVFRDGADPVTPQQRRQALLGMLYAPLVAQEILAGLKEGLAAAPMDFRLLVDDHGAGEDLLLDSATGIQPLNTPPEARPAFGSRIVADERRVEIAGRAFRIEAALTTAYERAVIDAAGWGPGLIGTLLTLLLAATTYLLAAGRARAQALADEMTEDLRRLTLDQQAMLDTEIIAIAKLRDRHIVWKNRALDRLFGYGPEELFDLPVRELYRDEATYVALGQNAYPVLRRGGHYRSQLQMRRKDGSLVWVDLNGVALPGERDANTSLWMMADITQSKDYEARVERAAFHDALTGLPNRVLLADRLRQAMAAAQRQGQTVAVAFLDLDGFKAVNDTHGHDAGDEVLQAVAQRLSEGIRASDTAARLGGDEFVVLLTPLPDTAASRPSAERLLRAILEPVKLSSGATVQVGASFGVAHFPLDGVDAEVLLSRADQAMFDSKRGGRCRIRWLDGAQPPQELDLSALRQAQAAPDGGAARRDDRSHAR
ncbi:CHASE domain-containing protein [Mitsuaria sp. GD03876]|uniref:sensor domain-containing diguanylate cyclase n=1 Tax=Mitsuaria sp. GD03876 TaxID=2975399 RepID=UPI00244ACCA8|nr:CHASE domain-containing protein [Mitsuaria sp. GD03876]MDH0867131.1 CHASE domain-containing protein [Mitsuaria sp. GD03876]